MVAQIPLVATSRGQVLSCQFLKYLYMGTKNVLKVNKFDFVTVL